MEDVDEGVVILFTRSFDAVLAVLVFLSNLEDAVDDPGFRNTSLGPPLFEGGFNKPPVFNPPEGGGVGEGVRRVPGDGVGLGALPQFDELWVRAGELACRTDK